MVKEADQNWPKSKLAEVEIGRSRNGPKSTAFHVVLLCFLVQGAFIHHDVLYHFFLFLRVLFNGSSPFSEANVKKYDGAPEKDPFPDEIMRSRMVRDPCNRVTENASFVTLVEKT